MPEDEVGTVIYVNGPVVSRPVGWRRPACWS